MFKLLILGSLLTVGLAKGSSEYYFLMSPGGLSSYCGETRESTISLSWIPTFVAGSMAEIVLRVHSTEPTNRVQYHGPDNEVPPGLDISIGVWDSVAKVCHWDPNLTDGLQLRHLKGPNIHSDIHFTISFPESMPEQLLCISARWTGSEWGDLMSIAEESGYNDMLGDSWKSRPLVIRIIPPCSESDRQRARESHVFEPWIVADWPRTLTTAESLLNQGWESFSVLMYAYRAAKELGQYQQALDYIDRCYQQYGRIGAISDSASQAQEYERMRSRLRELKANLEERQR